MVVLLLSKRVNVPEYGSDEALINRNISSALFVQSIFPSSEIFR